jgi:alcohol dehydrogenase class IV
MMKFEFATAQQIIFGPGVLDQACEKISSLGQRAFIVTGSSARNSDRLIDLLSEKQVQAATFRVSGEPV